MPGTPVEMTPRTREFYRSALHALDEARVPYLVGGTYALAHHAGIDRPTKDLDLFVRPDDRDRALGALAAGGLRTEVPYPHWVAKAFDGDDPDSPFLDLIYRSGNGLAEVDDGWFVHADTREFLGITVRLTPPEESLWSKAFVMERERYDGADVAHLILALGPKLDWARLLARFGPHWRVLFAHLILFGFIYPGHRDAIPVGVIAELDRRLRAETGQLADGEPVCQGTLLSRAQYLADLQRHGLEDGRVEPRGNLTPDQVAEWTEAIGRSNPS